MDIETKEMKPIRVLTHSIPDEICKGTNAVYSLVEWNKMRNSRKVKEQLASGTLYLTDGSIMKGTISELSTVSPENVLGTVSKIEMGYIEIIPINTDSEIALEKYIKARYVAGMRFIPTNITHERSDNSNQFMVYGGINLICYDLVEHPFARTPIKL